MNKYSILSDPRGLIFEAYRIKGIKGRDCRSIFFDWALGLSRESDPIKEINILFQAYSADNPSHPMNLVLQEGLSQFSGQPKRRLRSK
jgi:hypothetical protein